MRLQIIVYLLDTVQRMARLTSTWSNAYADATTEAHPAVAY